MRHFLLAGAMVPALAAALFPGTPATAAPTGQDGGFSFVVDAETEASNWKGDRDCKWSPPQSATATPGFYISKSSIVINPLSERGTRLEREIVYSNEITPNGNADFSVPLTITVRTYACSEKKPFGGGGKNKIEVTGEFRPMPAG